MERNKVGLRILTAHCLSESLDECSLAFFGIAGELVLNICIEKRACLANLEDAIYKRTSFQGKWQLITPNGKLQKDWKMVVGAIVTECRNSRLG